MWVVAAGLFPHPKHRWKACMRNVCQIKMRHQLNRDRRLAWLCMSCWMTERAREGDYLTSHMFLWIIPSFVAETMTAESRRLKTARTGHEHKHRRPGTHKTLQQSVDQYKKEVDTTNSVSTDYILQWWWCWVENKMSGCAVLGKEWVLSCSPSDNTVPLRWLWSRSCNASSWIVLIFINNGNIPMIMLYNINEWCSMLFSIYSYV